MSERSARKHMKTLYTFLGMIILVGFIATISAPAATIEGSVFFKGKKPKRRVIRMSADAGCVKANAGRKVYKENVVINKNGTLAHVLVYIKKGAKKTKAPTTPVKFDQTKCMYSPHILGVQVGQPIEIINSDSFLHNVHSMAKKNKNFNMGMATKGQKITKTFSKAEVPLKVKCDVHGWMLAYFGVFNHPYFAVTDSKGEYKLEGLPPGKYTVEAWHEKYKKKTAEITIAADGETKKSDFTYN